ncbi:hypothetical protein BKA61DRAFT_664919 [Leptodontidium sp. MPI-SDFR-AT-0119]|nr:hypothetical protein BKA61DRAFT_664919 [Leptodontidium sp. MPI-SDFR-AT-0119]
MPPASCIVKLPFSASLDQRWEQWLASSKQPAPVPGAVSSTSSSTQVSPQSAPSTKLSDLFSQSQLALVLVIVKAAPDGMSSVEYCQQLLKHTKAGRPVAPELYRYIDTTEYWKDMCDKYFEEKLTLESKVRCLEEAQRILKEKLRSNERSPPGDQAGSRSRSVREGGDNPCNVDAGTSRKRPAASQEILEDRLGDMSRIDDDICLILNARALHIIRQKTQLENAIQELNTLAQINALAKCINQTIILLETSISVCCLPLKVLKTDSNDSKILLLLQQVLYQVACTFHACFNAMNQLFLTISGRLNQAEIVSRMVMFFKKSLDFLQTICALQFADEKNQSPRSKRARLDGGEYAVNKYLAQALASIAKEMKWKINQPGHGDILEGMLFLVIQHTGRLISDSVFGEHVAASDNPANITNNRTPPSRGILRPESRYMVQVLYAALGGSDRDRKELVIRVVSAGCIAMPSASSTPGEMLNKAKKKLQGTLLQSMLGEIDSESFRPPKEPTTVSEVEDMRVDGERYGKEWLLETVWGLIGWD